MVAMPEQAAAKKKKIGIQLYSVMGAVQKDPAGSIKRLADMGYNVAELVQWGGDTKVFGLAPAEFKPSVTVTAWRSSRPTREYRRTPQRRMR